MESTKNNNSQKEEAFAFSDFSSSIKHILIPLPGFENYHQTGTESIEDKNFIGRKAIIAKLKSWLTNSKTYTGAYLITGYRGMGKSSFVGKVLYDLSNHPTKIPNVIHFIAKLILILVATYICYSYARNRTVNYFGVAGGISAVVGILVFAKIKALPKETRKLASLAKLIKNAAAHWNKTQYISVRINVGNEILHDREILSLICKSVYDKFLTYAKDPSEHLIYSYTVSILELSIVCLIFKFVHFFPLSNSTYTGLNKTMLSINEMFAYAWSAYTITPILFFIAVYFIIIYLIGKLCCLIEKIHFLPFSTFGSILGQLHHLCERCVATVSEDYSTTIQNIPINPFRKKNFQIASVREIEQSLISIFENIQNLRFIKLRFIIIFDELDKVDMKNVDVDNENEEPAYNLSSSGFSGTMNSRKRKEALMRTLADMKYFLSTVKAKFIFIAGRELYDAYLTDVSDREFSISSVFDGVINVNSFLKPSSSSKNITSMTEEYICNRLFPQNIDRERYDNTLKSYYKYEVERLKLNDMQTPAREKYRKRTIRNVSLLYQYSMYLAHISNGSPKKIAIYFEKDIRTSDYLSSSKDYQLEEKDCKFYLSFGVRDIQRIGFMHYIASPIVQAMINKEKIYEDKLLVSTSFMINHIYKYHNNGFSWRNLEHIPELLEINKTPELRDFIGSIISFLRQTHLESISSGLYLFKFPMKISEEISFLSKKSEEISAIFHFSRDESLPTKKHYTNLLKYYTSKTNTLNGQELHTLASIHHILADIYLADEDYSQAIFEYQTGLQLLSNQLNGNKYDENSHWVSYMLFLVRNMLKLGLTYEKRKTFDSAYLAYSELANTLIGYRFFDEQKWKLRYDIKDSYFQLEKDAILYPTDNPCDTNELIPSKWDESYKKYAFQGDHIRSEFARILTPLKSAIIMRMSFFNDIRLAYLPSLAKLFVLEKMNMEGITQSNIDIIEAEYFYLHVSTDDSEKAMVSADFFQKLGDIMYYKNGLLNKRMNNIFQSLYFWGFDLKKLIDDICLKEKDTDMTSAQKTSYYNDRKIMAHWFKSEPDAEQLKINTINDFKAYMKRKTKEKLNHPVDMEWDKLFNEDFPIHIIKPIRCMAYRNKMLDKGKRLPCYACKYYNKSLTSEMTRILNIPANELKILSRSIVLFRYLLKNKKQIESINESSNTLIANTLKGLGNVLLSCSDEGYTCSTEFLDYLFSAIRCYYDNKEVTKEISAFDNSLNPIEKALLYTAGAAIFFNIAGDKHSSFLMNKQILEILYVYLKVHKDKGIEIIAPYLKNIEELTCRAIMQLYSHYEHVNIAEIQQLKSLFGKGMHENVSLNTLPLSPDIEEVIYRYYTLEINCNRHDCIRQLYSCTLMGPYKQISTLCQNVYNLRFKILLNETIVEKIFNDAIKDDPSKNLKFDSSTGMSQNDYINSLYHFFRNNSELFNILSAYGIEIKDNKDINQRIEIINYFISDSLFCLSKIFDLIIPLNNTTLFPYYFLGEISEHLLRWNFAFEILHLVYIGVDYSDDESGQYSGKKLLSRYNNKNEDDLYLNFDHLKSAIASRTDKRNLADEFMKLVNKHISQDSFQHLINNYQMESAIRNYTKAIEMHTEGKAYKEFIKTLYFLDDDLNNDTCQQHISTERYLINTGVIDEKIRYLKNKSIQSPIYNLHSYLNH